LYLAGFRGAMAPSVFVAATILAFVLGLFAVFVFDASGLSDAMVAGVSRIPGGTGEVFLPLAWLAPWMMFFVVASIPWLLVRMTRQRRVEQVEQDLPLALEMFATLSEAGLGFDGALARILGTRLADRPLALEFRAFQADLLAGRPRHESLRRLARRLEVTSVTIFVSALVQADQLGMGLANVLRAQSDDMRNRRRERAMAFSNALAVKRLFPLVICFLPGLFVWTLGPIFLQLFQLADTFVQLRDL
jgi:tight adherence protein C